MIKFKKSGKSEVEVIKDDNVIGFIRWVSKDDGFKFFGFDDITVSDDEYNKIDDYILKTFGGEEKVEREVNVEIKTMEHEDIDLNTYSNHVKNGTVDEIENELAIIGLEGLGIPSTMLSLPLEAVNMLMFITSGETVCEYTNKKTLNNPVESYIEAFSNDKTVKYLLNRIFEYEKEYKYAIVDGDYVETNEVIKEGWVRKKGSNQKWNMLKGLAMKYWNENNLKTYLKQAKETFSDGGINFIDKFKDDVRDEALNNGDADTRIKYINAVMKMEGLDKNKGVQIVNLFDNHGGKELTKQSAKVSGNSLYDTDSIINADFDEVESGGDK